MKKCLFFLFFVLVQISYSQWETCNLGTYNGFISGLYVDGNNIFACTSSGVFFSTDDGDNWLKKNTGLVDTNVFRLLIDGKNILASTQQKGVYLSTDYGENWNELQNQFSDQPVYCFALSGNNIFAGTYGRGVFLSTDKGASWTKKNFGLTDTTIFTLNVTGNKVFAGSSQKGIFVSIDSGNTWFPKNNGLPDVGGFISINSININENIAYAAATFGIYVSNDFGENWIQKTPQNISNIGAITFSDNNIFAGSNDYKGVYVSSDKGDNWIAKNSGLLSKMIYCLSNNNKYVYAGTSTGISRAKISEITSVDSKNVENNLFEVFPNPANKNLSLVFNNKFIQNKVEIFNLLGLKVCEYVVEDKDFTINIETLLCGTYFLKIDNSCKIFVKN